MSQRQGDKELGVVIADYLLAHERHMSRETWKPLEANLQHDVLKRVGQSPIRAIDPTVLEQMYADALKTSLTRSAVLSLRHDLSNVFAWAVANRTISENIVIRSTVPPEGALRSATIGQSRNENPSGGQEITVLNEMHVPPATGFEARPRIDIDMNENNDDLVRPVIRLQQLLTVKEVCELTQTNTNTMYHLLCAGKGPESLKIGRNLRFRPAKVEEWLADLTAARA